MTDTDSRVEKMAAAGYLSRSRAETFITDIEAAGLVVLDLDDLAVRERIAFAVFGGSAEVWAKIKEDHCFRTADRIMAALRGNSNG